MQVFGHEVSNDLMTNLFYAAMRRAFRLKRQVHFIADISITDEEVTFYVNRSTVEERFVEFVEQPFVDEEILQRTAEALDSFAWQFRVRRITQNSAGIVLCLAALPIWALFFQRYGLLPLVLMIIGILLLSLNISVDFIKDEERLGYLPKTSAYKTMIEACKTARTLIDFKLQGSATIDRIIEKYHVETSAK